MNYLICYASGGLGNRLLPLSSSCELAVLLSRIVATVWNKTDSCHASFKSLFKSDIIEIDLKSIDLNDVSIYSNPSYIIDDYKLNGNSDLFELYSKVGSTPLSNLYDVFNDKKKYIIIYDNHFFLNLTNFTSFIKRLTINDSIIDEISFFKNLYCLDETVFGIHARGTDFVEEKLEKYIMIIQDLIKKDSNVKILFCSDNHNWERSIGKKFSNNVIIRKKSDHIRKNNIFFNWANNIFRSERSVIEGIIDIYLLASTNFVAYNKQSTFAQIVNHVRKAQI